MNTNGVTYMKVPEDREDLPEPLKNNTERNALMLCMFTRSLLELGNHESTEAWRIRPRNSCDGSML
jgi:hypothetical protein